MVNIETGQRVQARDFAQALAGQNGTFYVTKPGGQPLVVVCQEGYSIKSIRAAGSAAPSFTILPQSDIWEIEKLNNSTEVPLELDLGQQGQQHDRSRSQSSQQR